MALPPRNAAEAVRRKQSYIRQQLAKGRSRNSIRKELIEQGMRKVSRAYFNEVVSELTIADAPVAVSAAASPQVADQAPQPSAPVAASALPKSPEVTWPKIPRGGNFVDDRFDNDL